MKLYNLEKIESIELMPKLQNDWYIYHSPIIKRGKVKEPERFNFIGNFKTKEDVLKDGDYYIENNKVFYKPHIIIQFVSNNIKRIYFENENELDNYALKLQEKLKFKFEKLQ